jgi:hypothetical protein
VPGSRAALGAAARPHRCSGDDRHERPGPPGSGAGGQGGGGVPPLATRRGGRRPRTGAAKPGPAHPRAPGRAPHARGHLAGDVSRGRHPARGARRSPATDRAGGARGRGGGADHPLARAPRC